METATEYFSHCILTIKDNAVTEVRVNDIRDLDEMFEFHNNIIYHKSTHCFISIKALSMMLLTSIQNSQLATEFYKCVSDGLPEINFQLKDVNISKHIIDEIIKEIDKEHIYGDSQATFFMTALQKIKKAEEERENQKIIADILRKKWAD